MAREAFKLAGIKLPLPTRFMKREGAAVKATESRKQLRDLSGDELKSKAQS